MNNQTDVHVQEPSDGTKAQARTNFDLTDVDAIVSLYYPRLIDALHASLAVFGAMALAKRTRPLTLISETHSGYGKTATLQMAFPAKGSGLDDYVYRSDKFTPKSFVSHAANVSGRELQQLDLLPKIKGKVVLTKELAPILRGRNEELQDNFSILIPILDGKGFISDSGMRGRRGYEESIIFNWLGATTPLPASTHRLMAQLGTRLLFYEIQATEPTEEELLAYAKKDDAGPAEQNCQTVVNHFLVGFFAAHPVGSVPPEAILIPTPVLKQIVKWAKLLVKGRAEVKFEKDDADYEPIAALPTEGPWKVVDYFKELARGHALIHGRTEVNDQDLQLIGHVALSSVPGHLRPIVRTLRHLDSVDTPACVALCKVSRPTARRYMKELNLLGIVTLMKGTSSTNEADHIALSEDFRWLILEH